MPVGFESGGEFGHRRAAPAWRQVVGVCGIDRGGLEEGNWSMKDDETPQELSISFCNLKDEWREHQEKTFERWITANWKLLIKDDGSPRGYFWMLWRKYSWLMRWIGVRAIRRPNGCYEARLGPPEMIILIDGHLDRKFSNGREALDF